MISFYKIFYVSFIELLVLLNFLYMYFMGSDPNVVNSEFSFSYLHYSILTDFVKHFYVKKTLSLPVWLVGKDGVNCSKIFQVALMNYFHVSKDNK